MTSELLASVVSEKMKAMRDREGGKTRKNVLTLLQSEVKQVEVDERREATDADVRKVAEKARKRLMDAAESFREAGREDLVDKAHEEAAILEEFLPKFADEAMVRKWASENMDLFGPTVRVGEVQGMFIKTVRSMGYSVDGAMVAKIIQEIRKGQ